MHLYLSVNNVPEFLWKIKVLTFVKFQEVKPEFFLRLLCKQLSFCGTKTFSLRKKIYSFDKKLLPGTENFFLCPLSKGDISLIVINSVKGERGECPVIPPGCPSSAEVIEDTEDSIQLQWLL